MSRGGGITRPGLTYVELSHLAQRQALESEQGPRHQVLWLWLSPQRTSPPGGGGSSFLLSDFVASLNANRESEHYGSLMSALSLGEFSSEPLYAEYSLGLDGSWVVISRQGKKHQMWLMDLRDPVQPRLRRPMKLPPQLKEPRTVSRLPDNRILVSFANGSGGAGGGGLGLYDSEGTLIRSSLSQDPRDISLKYQPFGLLPVWQMDRLVTTNYAYNSELIDPLIQIWRLSDLSLLHTLRLVGKTSGSTGTTVGKNEGPFEMVPLPDLSVLVFTRPRGGIWRISQFGSGTQPKVEMVTGLSVADGELGIPLWVEPGWILVPVSQDNSLLVLDVNSPDKYVAPQEHHRFRFHPQFNPFWLSYDEVGHRVCVMDLSGRKIYILDFDPQKGTLHIDPESHFGSQGKDISQITRWPQGRWDGQVICRGVVFGSYFGAGPLESPFPLPSKNEGPPPRIPPSRRGRSPPLSSPDPSMMRNPAREEDGDDDDDENPADPREVSSSSFWRDDEDENEDDDGQMMNANSGSFNSADLVGDDD